MTSTSNTPLPELDPDDDPLLEPEPDEPLLPGDKLPLLLGGALPLLDEQLLEEPSLGGGPDDEDEDNELGMSLLLYCDINRSVEALLPRAFRLAI